METACFHLTLLSCAMTYWPSAELREGNVFSSVCLSFWLSTGRGIPCDHYLLRPSPAPPQTSDIGPNPTGPAISRHQTWWPALETSLNLSTWDTPSPPPPTGTNVWWLLKELWAVHILLECFLVYIAVVSLSVHLAFTFFLYLYLSPHFWPQFAYFTINKVFKTITLYFLVLKSFNFIRNTWFSFYFCALYNLCNQVLLSNVNIR